MADIAQFIGVTSKPRQVFLVCFFQQHQDLDDTALAKKIWAPSEIKEPVKTMVAHLKLSDCLATFRKN